jgi:hypothetical protein
LTNVPVNPANFTRTQVTEDFHSPVYDSFSFELQRELTATRSLRVGYVGSKGTVFSRVSMAIRFASGPTRRQRINPPSEPIRHRTNPLAR